MGIKLSISERRLLAVVALAGVFYFFFTSLLDPLLIKVIDMRREIVSIKRQVELLKIESSSVARPDRAFAVLPSKEEQAGRILSYLEGKFRSNALKIDSLQQSSADGIITMDLRFAGPYKRVRGVLSSLKGAPSIISISEVSLTQDGKGLAAFLKIMAPYK